MPIDLSVWEQKVFDFGVDIPLPPMPEPPAEWGLPGVGLDLKATCPGAPFCGNPDADKNCSKGVKKPLTIPEYIPAIPFPPEINIPPMKFRVVFPPTSIIPTPPKGSGGVPGKGGGCPNYPDKEAHG
jgi:hypothetical protein